MLHRLASLLLVGLVALGGAASAVAQQGGSGFSATPLDPAGQEHTAAIKGATLPMAPAAVAEQAAAIGSGADKRVSVIVKLDVDSLAAYEGGLPGLPATSPRVTGAPALDATAPASRLYLDYVAQEIDTFASTAKASLSSAVITHRYDVVVGGVTMIVRADEVEALAALPGVQAIYPDTLQQLETDTSPQFIGAQSTWDQLGGQGSAGEGVIVGVLDTGIWPEHPSLADPDPLGKPYAPPPPAPDGDRQCEFSGGANPGAPFTCNNKLIGADRFMATYDAVIGLLPTEFTTARDDNGHGTHTSTTAAGNRGVQASIFGIPRGTISGIAPRAHVIMYKVCGDQGCFTSDSAAAVQEAIQDGVNVINFSISGGTSPYADAVSLAFLDAYAAGVFVAASAGNTGPGADTVNHREPWVTTVAASVTNRHFLSTVTLTAAGGATLQLTGATITPGISTPTPVVNAADPPFNDPLCLEDGPDNAFAGVVVVCERGVIGRLQKSSNVAQRGAAGMLLYNAIPQGLNTDNHWVPSVHLESDAGAALLDFLEANSGELVTFTAGEATRVQGDVMAPFSSRGGPGQTLGVNKPDVTAPGVQILAGHSAAPATRLGGPPGELFQSIQGTSMSSPHVAGAAALLKDAFPTFTPGQIKSALMTTARTNGLVKEDGATPFTPFDAGSGRIDLHRAWDPGITFAESAANFVALQSQLWHANLPSLYVPVMPGRVTVQRTAQDVTGAAASYTTGVLYPQNQPRDFTVTVPASLGIAANGTHTFAITVDARDVPLGEVRHATIVFSGDNGRTARFPVTIVRRQPAITLEKSCAPATIARGSATTCSITMANTTFDPAPVSMSDTLPRELRLVSSSITGGASPSGNGVAFSGTLFGASPPNVAVGPGTSPAGGYLPLSIFGIPPVGGVTDDSITNFNTAPFLYGGEVYTRIGFSSNGYAVVGGGSGPDNTFLNQSLPNPTRPNNVLAPFWTDLNPPAGGALRIAVLTDRVNNWLVLDWAAVREFSQPRFNSFQIWIGLNNDASPSEDISFAYGTIQGNGDLGLLTVGAENRFGNRGQNHYYNGTGTLPSFGTQLRVTTTPGAPGETRTVTFQATGVRTGAYVNYAEMTSPNFFGTNVARFAGQVTR